jgi:hypothetical protein
MKVNHPSMRSYIGLKTSRFKHEISKNQVTHAIMRVIRKESVGEPEIALLLFLSGALCFADHAEQSFK